jgi:hypothetical protein
MRPLGGGGGVTANILNKQVVVAGMEIGLAANGAEKVVLSSVVACYQTAAQNQRSW